MKQHIEVRSVVRKDDKVLLLKRADGREDLRGKYEFPGGRVEQDEQPEEAIARLVKEATGFEVHNSYLSDVFTYVDKGERVVQRAVIVYIVSVSGGENDVQLGPNYSHYSWRGVADIEQDDVTDLSHVLLAIQKDKPGVTATTDGVRIQKDVSYSSRPKGGMLVYSDGGSRGNPGPSAAGYVIKDSQDRLAHEGGAYLGITTNNQAEYHGVRLGLEKAKELGAKTVDCYVDSMLVVNQLNGQYVIRNRELWPIHERIKELVSQFEKVNFRHVKREFNQQADRMVNKILDARAREGDEKV